MVKRLLTLTLIFKDHISMHEVPLLRGAVIACIGDDVNILYHNHVGDNDFRSKYPLIQYKQLGGHAAIVCVN